MYIPSTWVPFVKGLLGELTLKAWCDTVGLAVVGAFRLENVL